MRPVRAFLIVAGLCCPACGSSTPTSPSTPSPTPTPTPTYFSGTWNGPVTDSICGAGTFQGVLTQSGSSVTGTGSVAFARVGCGGISGRLNGTASGVSLQATLESGDTQYCPLALAVTLSGSTFSGTYVAISCSYGQTGSVSATQTK